MKNKILKTIVKSLLCGFGIFSLVLPFTFAPMNKPYLFSKIPNYNNNEYCEISVKSKSNYQDYYYLDYQFRNEDIEELMNLYYKPQMFIFKSYNTGIPKNGDSENKEFYSTEIFSNTEYSRVVWGINTKISRLFLSSYISDYYGVSFMAHSITGNEYSNSCIVSYETAIDYCKCYLGIANPSDDDIKNIVDKELVLNESKYFRDSESGVSAIIKGVLNKRSSMTDCKLPKGITDFIFLSNTFYLKSSPKIYIKLPDNQYIFSRWINSAMKRFDIDKNSSRNSNDFSINYNFVSIDDNSVQQIYTNETVKFNDSIKNDSYTIVLLASCLNLLLLIFIFLIFRKQIFPLFNGLLIDYLILPLSFAFFYSIYFLFNVLINNLLYYSMFGSFVSQFILIFSILYILCGVFLNEKKRAKN